MKQIANYTLNAAVLLSVALASGCVIASDPVVDNSGTSRKLERLERRAGERPVVTVYRFRSGVREVTAEAATDMFTTALIKSGAFAVAERAQLNEGVLREKQLNDQGMTEGDTAQHKLAGARYIFEGTVSEANANKSRSGVGGSVRGLGIETKGADASIGIDVRVVDARNGLVLDAVNVRKNVKQAGAKVTGIGSFVQSYTKTNLQGADLNVGREAKEGVDEALRQCVEEAVYQLARRYGS